MSKPVPIPPLEIPRPPVPQPAEKLFLLVCDQEAPQMSRGWEQRIGVIGGVGGGIGGYPVAAPEPTFRRATPDDLHAFGFAAIPPGIPELPSEDSALSFALQSIMNRLTVHARRELLAMLNERYGDG